MKLSGRLTPEHNIVSDVCTIGDISSEYQEVMEEVYTSEIPEYRDIKNLYDTCSKIGGSVSSDFPAKCHWNPDGQSLSIYDRELLVGPQLRAKFFAKVSVTDDVTKREIVYHRYCSYSGKVCSSFVRLKSAPIATFGRIQQLFKHNFANHEFEWALVELFGQVTRDSESALWHAQENITDVHPVLLKELSRPLVVAKEADRVWFLSPDH